MGELSGTWGSIFLPLTSCVTSDNNLASLSLLLITSTLGTKIPQATSLTE